VFSLALAVVLASLILTGLGIIPESTLEKIITIIVFAFG
jgi:hypothetical protein